MTNDIRIEITGESIKLDQLLKLTNLVVSGGEAKQLVLAGEVFVNGEVEFRRGRKIKKGDTVFFREHEINVG
ncbi:MAG: ribosome-associated protein [Firmicutes bacterium ADurb.Bin193]|nr:MAG: ribosome-associated protein [Firmicutes bacterium ADurb.Bin193]